MSVNKDTVLKKLFSSLEEKTLSVAEKIEVQKFLVGKPVATVKGNVFTANSISEAVEQTKKWAEQYSHNITREDIGEVVLSPRGIKNSLGHEFDQKKLDAIPAIPAAIKQGKILKIEKDKSGEIDETKKNKRQMNVFLAAPIKIDNDKDILFVRLRQNEGDSTRFYVHEVFNKKDIKSAIPSTAGSQANSKGRPHGGIAVYINILKDIFDVK